MNQILKTKDKELRDLRLKELWRIWQKEESFRGKGKSLRFYRVKELTVPELKSANLLSRELLYEMALGSLDK